MAPSVRLLAILYPFDVGISVLTDFNMEATYNCLPTLLNGLLLLLQIYSWELLARFFK